MYFDDLLTEHIGEFGRYQILLFIGIYCISIPATFDTMGIVFIAGIPRHWCDVPALRNLSVTTNTLLY